VSAPAVPGLSNAPAAPPRPGPGAPRPYHFPPFERRTLANGLTLVVATVRRLPVVSVAAVVDAGAAADPAGQEGLAVLTARALAEGTASLDALALADRVERLGASLDAGADWDAAVVGLTTLAPKLDAAFEVMAEVLARPSFPAYEVERLRQERLADLLHLRSDPARWRRRVRGGGVRPRVALRAARGRGEAAVGGLTRDAVAAFHAARYAPGGTTLVVAGDVTADAAEALVARTLGTWAGGAPAPAAADDRQAGAGGRVHLVAKPDAVQCELRVGHVGPRRDTPDYLPARGDEQHPRRAVQLARQPQPARAQRLHLRRPHRLRLAPLGGAVLGGERGWRPTRRGRRGRGALEIDRMRDELVRPRRAVARDELPRRRVPHPLRDHVGHRVGAHGLRALRPARRLLRRLPRARARRDGEDVRRVGARAPAPRATCNARGWRPARVPGRSRARVRAGRGGRRRAVAR
jgi:hypothetical protein